MSQEQFKVSPTDPSEAPSQEQVVADAPRNIDQYLENLLPDDESEPYPLFEAGEKLTGQVRGLVEGAVQDADEAIVDAEYIATEVAAEELPVLREESGVVERLSQNTKRLYALAGETVAKIGDVAGAAGDEVYARSRHIFGALLAAGALSASPPPEVPTPQSEYAAAMADSTQKK